MSLQGNRRSSSKRVSTSRGVASPDPGKHTLSEQLPASATTVTRPPAAGAGANVGARATSASAPPASAHRLDALFRGGSSSQAGAIQRRSNAQSPEGNATPSPGGQGQPLPAQLRSKMEGTLGAEFSAVRVHEGVRAASLGALAYTEGTNIHFAPGQYQPDTRQGQELLGHELTHVVQQAQGRVQTTGQAKGVAINNDPALEHEADVMGGQAARGEVTHAPCGGCGTCASCRGPGVAAQRKAEPGVLQLQLVGPASGTPGGPDPCRDLLQQIIDLLDLVAQLFREAEDDPHNLYRDHRGMGDPHPDYGSWDGHRQSYDRERGRLRLRIAEWESNDDCGDYQLSPQQQEDLNEAREFGARPFPNRPVNSMYEDNAPQTSSGSSLWSGIATILEVAGLSLLLIPEIIVDVGDPEPATKLASLGLTLATINAILVLVGRPPISLSGDDPLTSTVDPQLLHGGQPTDENDPVAV